MNYQLLAPHDSLRKYIRYYWLLENEANPKTPRKLAPLPDGCPGILFQQSSHGTLLDPTHKLLPEIFIYGQTIKPTEFSLQGKFQTIGICFYPYALKSIFGLHASEFTDACLDLTLITHEIKEQLLNSPSVMQQVEVLSSYILNQIRKKDRPVDQATEYALTHIAKSKGNIPLKEVQKTMQLSERGFQWKFDQYVGISPKLFARVCRFQASFGQMKNNNYNNLSDLAFDNGYADQSHFIRSFKEFTGLSPHQFQKGNRKLAENFSVF
jgi:AraC-like DNA-binding protein